MKLWSSNLYKAGWVVVGDETRVINSDEQMKSRLERAKAEGFLRKETAVEDADGQETVLKASDLETQETVNEELEAAKAELALLKEEASHILDNANAQIEAMRRKALEEAREQGFQEGYQEGMNQVGAMKNECQAERR